MGRFRKPTVAESNARRHELMVRARRGELQLPSAVRDMRLALGLSQEAFARLIKLTTRQLAEIERGEANPTIATISRIGRLFGFSLAFVPYQKAEPRSTEPPLAEPHSDAESNHRRTAM